MNYEQKLAGLTKEIGLLDSVSSEPIVRLKINLPLITGAISAVRKAVVENGFENQAAEIHFFKQVKPQFYALLIYETDLYHLLVNRPLGTPGMLRAYYEQELVYVMRLYRIHAFHYQYYRMGAGELDSLYFTRDGQPADIPVLAGIDTDPGFTTPLDYLFAKFIAAERYQAYLLEQLSSEFAIKPVKRGPVLRWTGEAIHLAELAYGIHLTGQLNNGNATLTDISRHLEQVFGVAIGTPAKKWEQIAARKTTSPTKYIDQMRQALLARLDRQLAAPGRKARRVG